MQATRQDFRYALRAFRAKPLSTTVALATLALGIGATAAMFSVVNGVLLRPLPYDAPNELVHIRGVRQNEEVGNVSYPDFMALRDRAVSLSGLSVWQGWEITIDDETGAPTRRRAASVSYNFFEILRARPSLGRFFTIEEDEVGHTPVVVISHGLWQTSFGGDPTVMGASLQLEGEPYTIIGVTAPGFVDPIVSASPWDAPQVWRSHPPVFDRAASNPTWRGFWAVGRLASGYSLEDAVAEVRVLGASLADSFPESNAGFGFHVKSAREQLVGDVRPAVLLLLVAVSLLLLIACANVANILLSRATARRHEIALRTALGASRWRLVRQLLTESTALALLGGLLGLALARVGLASLVALGRGGLPRLDEISLDADVFLFTFGAALLTALVFGLGPAFYLTGTSVSKVIGAASRGGALKQSHRLRNSLVVAEVSIAVVLLVGAGLLLKSMQQLQRVDTGMVVSGVLTMRVTPSVETYSDGDDLTGVVARLLDGMRSLPGVAFAAAISDLPLSGAVNSVWMFRDDVARPPSGQEPLVLIRAISPDYLRAMGIRLEGGRGFTDVDRRDAPRVVIVNQALARRYFPNVDPIGKRISLMGVSREIVGVTGDVKQFGLARETEAAVYTPYSQESEEWLRRSMTFVLRTDGDPALWGGAVRSAVRDVDPSMPVNDLEPMSKVLQHDVAEPRFRTVLLTTFASLALLLAAVGIGGVMAYNVSQRTREIAVRVALGADDRRIVSMVLRQGAKLTAAGIGLGVVGGLLGGRFLSSLLFGVTPHDTSVIGVVVLLLATVALLSSYLPARRATHVEPAVALRSE